MGTRHQLKAENLRVLTGEVDLDALLGGAVGDRTPRGAEATFGTRDEVAARLLCLEQSVAALFAEAEVAKREQESAPPEFVAQLTESQQLHAKLKEALAASADVLAQSAELMARIRGESGSDS